MSNFLNVATRDEQTFFGLAACNRKYKLKNVCAIQEYNINSFRKFHTEIEYAETTLHLTFNCARGTLDCTQRNMGRVANLRCNQTACQL